MDRATYRQRSDGVSIVAAREEDLDEIAEMVSLLYENEFNLRPVNVITDRDRIIRKTVGECFGRSDHGYILAIVENKIAGVVHVTDTENSSYVSPVHTGWISEVFVREDYRDNNLGRDLVRAAEAWCRERGLTEIGLSVNSLNTIAANLYGQLAYRVTYNMMEKSL